MNWLIPLFNRYHALTGTLTGVVALPLLCVSFALTVGAQSALAQSGIIALSELPTPPGEIAQLLKSASVEFTYGSQHEPASVLLADGRRAQAVTDFNLSYKFKTFNRTESLRGRKRTTDSINPNSVALTGEHVVWFRERPDLATFWTNWLVRHELDHVRISSDPSLEKRFRALLVEDSDSQSEVTSPAAKSTPKQTKERVEEAFQQVVSLVDIRYKELDRLTNHGSIALPNGTSLELLFRPIQPESSDK